MPKVTVQTGISLQVVSNTGSANPLISPQALLAYLGISQNTPIWSSADLALVYAYLNGLSLPTSLNLPAIQSIPGNGIAFFGPNGPIPVKMESARVQLQVQTLVAVGATAIPYPIIFGGGLTSDTTPLAGIAGFSSNNPNVIAFPPISQSFNTNQGNVDIPNYKQSIKAEGNALRIQVDVMAGFPELVTGDPINCLYPTSPGFGAGYDFTSFIAAFPANNVVNLISLQVQYEVDIDSSILNNIQTSGQKIYVISRINPQTGVLFYDPAGNDPSLATLGASPADYGNSVIAVSDVLGQSGSEVIQAASIAIPIPIDLASAAYDATGTVSGGLAASANKTYFPSGF